MRSLPEHTVDCWVSAAVLAEYPEALLWAPTQHGPDNWDIAFEETGSGKAFILENKGTECTDGQHTIEINMEQLDIYLRSPGASVYYVLPVPPWPARESVSVLSAAYPVPAAAQCRLGTGHRHGPFTDWCRVIEAWGLYDWLKDYGSKTRTFRAPDIIACPLAVKLGEFLEGVRTCTHGGPRYESAADAHDGWAAQLRQRQDQLAAIPVEPNPVERRVRSGVLGVFVPV